MNKEVEFMKGIRLKHGVSFVECDGVTVRINKDGSCELASLLLPSLEWDLRCEPPESWDYIYDSDIDSLCENARQKIEETVRKFRDITEG